MKNKKIRIIIIFLLILISVFLIYKYFFAGDKNPIVVETAAIKNGDVITTVTATGTINPVNEVTVGTQVSGIIQKIYVDYNSKVSRGQLLAELDKTNLSATVTEAQANYTSSLNELSYQKQNYDRQKKMYDAQVISKADYETAQFSLKNAQQSVTQAESTLERAQTNLGYANIYSPIDGVVVTKEVEEGQTVTASMSTPTLFTIAQDLTKMQVEADVDEADIGEVKEGQRVTFTVDAYPGATFNGTVNQVRLGATVTSNVVTYTVVIVTDNQDLKLKPGLTATITIYTKELTDIPVIEAKALNFEIDEATLQKYYEENDLLLPDNITIKRNTDKAKYVWVKNKNGTLEQKSITTGENDGINIQVLSGLKLGEEVVYNMKAAQEGTSTTSGNTSPFMPQRPGSNRSSNRSSSNR